MRVHNAFVLYLLSVTALQKDEGYFPSAAVLEPKYSSKISNDGCLREGPT